MTQLPLTFTETAPEAPSPPVEDRDRYDVRLAARARDRLRAFNEVGLLSSADVHVAQRLCALAGEMDETVALALALAVRGPRLGHVFTDLATIRETAIVDSDEPVDLSTLPWPEPDPWLAAVQASPAVAGADGPDDRPVRLSGTALYLDRYWQEESRLADDLRAFAAEAAADVDGGALRAGLDRLFGGEDDRSQRLAATAAVLRRLAVVAGGPGTGKTTTVARIVALMLEQPAATPPLVALAAPTGKAAARLQEAVHAEAERLDVAPVVREALLGLEASTLHRLLGWKPGSHSRFRHHRANRLPHDVVIVDETSMVSLSLMTKLVEAVRPDASLILVGDPAQLTSVEAGAVLGDVVGPAVRGLQMRVPAREALAAAAGVTVEAEDPPGGVAVGDGIVVLDRVHRYGGEIAALAAAIRAGDAGETLALLGGSATDAVQWLPVDAPTATPDELAPLRALATATGLDVRTAARAGDAATALDALARFRLLCAHRRGPHGARTWMTHVESWLAELSEDFASEGQWYVGRPLLVTENDYPLRLYNGDTGVVVETGPGQVAAAFDRGGELLSFAPARLGAVETVYAMTVHKAQGSQFATSAILLPEPASPILTRELLYTAVTRAQERVVLIGTEEAIRAGVERPVARASGLGQRLWGSVA
jgi:exodeoxyribonuclease V alpha subunit